MSFNEHEWIRACVREAIARKKTSQQPNWRGTVESVMAKKKQTAEPTPGQAESEKTQVMPCKRRGVVLRNCEPFVSAMGLLEAPDVQGPNENGFALKYADDVIRIWLHADELFVQIEHRVDGKWTVTECYQ